MPVDDCLFNVSAPNGDFSAARAVCLDQMVKSMGLLPVRDPHDPVRALVADDVWQAVREKATGAPSDSSILTGFPIERRSFLPAGVCLWIDSKGNVVSQRNGRWQVILDLSMPWLPMGKIK